MSLTPPVGVQSAAEGWSLVSWRRVSLTSAAAAGGECRVTFDQLEQDELWLIDRAVSSCTSATSTALRCYDGEPAVSRLLSGTNTGNFDEADYSGGLLVEPVRQLVAVWSGAAAGSVGTLALQIREFRRRA